MLTAQIFDCSIVMNTDGALTGCMQLFSFLTSVIRRSNRQNKIEFHNTFSPLDVAWPLKKD